MLKNKDTILKIAKDTEFPTASTLAGTGIGALAAIAARKFFNSKDMDWKDYLMWGLGGAAAGGGLGYVAGSDMDAPNEEDKKKQAAPSPKKDKPKNPGEDLVDKSGKLVKHYSGKATPWVTKSLADLAILRGTLPKWTKLSPDLRAGLFNSGSMETAIAQETAPLKAEADKAGAEAADFRKQRADMAARFTENSPATNGLIETEEETRAKVKAHNEAISKTKTELEDAVKKHNEAVDAEQSYAKSTDSVEGLNDLEAKKAAERKIKIESEVAPEDRPKIKAIADKISRGESLDLKERGVVHKLRKARTDSIVKKYNNLPEVLQNPGMNTSDALIAKNNIKTLLGAKAGKQSKKELANILKELEDLESNKFLTEVLKDVESVDSAGRAVGLAATNQNARTKAKADAVADTGDVVAGLRKKLNELQTDSQHDARQFRLKALADLDTKAEAADKAKAKLEADAEAVRSNVKGAKDVDGKKQAKFLSKGLSLPIRLALMVANHYGQDAAYDSMKNLYKWWLK